MPFCTFGLCLVVSLDGLSMDYAAYLCLIRLIKLFDDRIVDNKVILYEAGLLCAMLIH